MSPLAVFALIVAMTAQAADLREGTYRGRPAWILSNSRVELTVLARGGAFARIVLRDDPNSINPLWDAFAQDEAQRQPLRTNGETGHFVCVDGFGPSSAEERAAGMPSEHGEAHALEWSLVRAPTESARIQFTQTVRLPLAHETFTRTINLADGTNIIRVRSRLESLLAFDRPAFWVEHATIGPPFLEPGATVIDLSENRALTRPWPQEEARHRLATGHEFRWPLAPSKSGGDIDLRETPEMADSLDQTGHSMNAGRPYAFATALNRRRRLLLGYVFRPAEYPWLQNWQSYLAHGHQARGLEFGTTLFGRPRREILTENRLFGELLYRSLPARSAIESTYLMFWTLTPEGFRAVDDVEVLPDRLRIMSRKSSQEIILPLS
jgi:hypothetical protein